MNKKNIVNSSRRKTSQFDKKTTQNDYAKKVNINKASDRYYKCYSVKLNEFLKSKNLKCLKEIRHPKTNKIAFIYEKNEKLDELLTFWSQNGERNDTKVVGNRNTNSIKNLEKRR